MKSAAGGRRFAVSKNRLIIGVLMAAAAILLALVVIPFLQARRVTEYPVLLLKRDVAAGEVFADNDFTASQTVDPALAKWLLSDASDAVGKVASHALKAGSCLLADDVVDTYAAPTIYNSIPDEHMMISVSVTSLAQSVSGQVKPEDIVRLYAIDESGMAYTPEELQYVKVLGVYNAEGSEIPEAAQTDAFAGNAQSTVPSSVSLLATQRQALRIIELEKSGTLYLSLLSRDHAEQAEAYLALQASSLRDLGKRLPERSVRP